MIDLTFQFGGEMILIKIEGNSVTFGSTDQGAQMAPIDGLKIDKKGVIKEFPDLKGNPEWRIEAIKRFKEKIRQMKTERNKADYIISDLKKFGYIPKRIQINGRRPENING